MKLFKKILSLSLVLAICLLSLPMTFVGAETTAKMIYQIEPGKTGQTAGSDVTEQSWFVAVSGFKTYVREDSNGYYYSTEVGASTGEKYTYFNSGWTSKTLPLLGNAEVLNKLCDYMQISLDIRITSDSAISDNVSVDVVSYPDAENILRYTSGAVSVPSDGEWHTYTYDGTGGSLAGTYMNQITLITENPNASDVRVEIRNLSVSLKESDKDAINSALSGTGYTYESLTSYVPFNSDDIAASKVVKSIFQIDPGKSGQAVGSNAAISQVHYSNYGWAVAGGISNALICEDEKGYYYSAEIPFDGTDYGFVSSGYTSETMPLLDSAVLSKLLPYMNVSLEARAVSQSETVENISFELHGIRSDDGATEFTYVKSAVPSNGEWQTITYGCSAASLDDGYYDAFRIVGSNPFEDAYNLEFRNIVVSLRESDKSAINTALEGTGYTYESLTGSHVNTSVKKNIWQATPEYFGSFDGADATWYQDVWDAHSVLVKKDTEGLYYSVDNYDSRVDTWAYIDTGWHDSKLPWLAEKDVIEAIIPYMQISAYVRVRGYDAETYEDADVSNISLSIDAVQPWDYDGAGMCLIGNTDIISDGEWHKIEQSGAIGSPLYDWYAGILLVQITNPDASSFEFDIKNVTISLKESDKEAINTALANVNSEYNSYDALTDFITFYNLDTIIWYADSNKSDKAMNNGGEVDVTPDPNYTNDWEIYSAYSTSAEFNSEDGAYYSTQMSALGYGGDGQNSLINSGINRKNKGYGWMANVDVLNALRPYMNIGLQYRVTGNIEGNFDITIRSANDWCFTGWMTQFAIQGTDMWYESSYTPLYEDFSADWGSGYFSPSIWSDLGDLGGSQTIDIRGLNIAVSSEQRENINAALSKIEGIDNIKNFTAGIVLDTDENGNKDYFSLLSSASNTPEFDVNDDGEFDVRDLVSAKKYATVYSYVPQYILERIDMDNNDEISATDLAELRKGLLNVSVVRNDYVIDLQTNHPGVADMDATYVMTISDKQGNALDSQDFDWNANFESVTVDGNVITVPYSVRSSSKELIITAINKENPALYSTYTFDFQQFSGEASFIDEFDGTEIDSEKWSVQSVSAEDSYGSMTVSDGAVTFSVADDTQKIGISTEGKYNQTFGSFSAKMKFPTKGSVNSAFWLMNYGGYYVDPDYPNNSEGEIDIVEYLPGTNTYASSVHWNGYVENDLYKKSAIFSDTYKPTDHRHDNFDSLNVNDGEYHIASVVWTKDAIYWYLDGNLIYIHTGEGVGTGGGSMFMLFDLAGMSVFPEMVGKYDKEDFPVSLTVDWVKAYNLD